MRLYAQITSFFIPDFIDIQRKSFYYFLETGIIKEFAKRNFITNFSKDLELIFYPEYYKLNPPEWNTKQAILKAKTYSCRLYVPAQLTNYQTQEIKLKWVLLGNLPLMTKRGHFIINGSPRVIINQMIRSPGIYYQQVIDKKKKRTYYADIISHRGAWLRLETDKKRRIWARMKKNPKVSILVFLQAMGLTKESIFQSINYSEFLKFSFLKDNHPISTEEALITFYSKTHPKKDKTEITPTLGQKFLFRKFLNPKTYDLGHLGRLRLNKKLGVSIPISQQILTSEDILYATDYLINLEYGLGSIDDIDHLKNRRVRPSGELIQNQLGTGLIRLEKMIREKMKKPKKNLSIRSLLTTKPINGALREFFGSSQLSQFMDQTNPLAEITHKRRLSSLGPGGISRETAGMAVRGIHPTHYGRICPIETPEGPNAGLVNSITTYARINLQGFLETPFFQLYRGQIQKQNGSFFISAEQEEKLITAPADLKISILNFLPKTLIPIRRINEFKRVSRQYVQYIAFSPIQMISIATSLIPFLEHDDANRALMGSNMQRQAVPLIKAEQPMVGTGLEMRVASDSGHILQALKTGYVYYVSAQKITLINKKTGDKKFQGKKFSKLVLPRNCYKIKKIKFFNSNFFLVSLSLCFIKLTNRNDNFGSFKIFKMVKFGSSLNYSYFKLNKAPIFISQINFRNYNNFFGGLQNSAKESNTLKQNVPILSSIAFKNKKKKNFLFLNNCSFFYFKTTKTSLQINIEKCFKFVNLKHISVLNNFLKIKIFFKVFFDFTTKNLHKKSFNKFCFNSFQIDLFLKKINLLRKRKDIFNYFIQDDIIYYLYKKDKNNIKKNTISIIASLLKKFSNRFPVNKYLLTGYPKDYPVLKLCSEGPIFQRLIYLLDIKKLIGPSEQSVTWLLKKNITNRFCQQKSSKSFLYEIFHKIKIFTKLQPPIVYFNKKILRKLIHSGSRASFIVSFKSKPIYIKNQKTKPYRRDFGLNYRLNNEKFGTMFPDYFYKINWIKNQSFYYFKYNSENITEVKQVTFKNRKAELLSNYSKESLKLFVNSKKSFEFYMSVQLRKKYNIICTFNKNNYFAKLEHNRSSASRVKYKKISKFELKKIKTTNFEYLNKMSKILQQLPKINTSLNEIQAAASSLQTFYGNLQNSTKFRSFAPKDRFKSTKKREAGLLKKITIKKEDFLFKSYAKQGQTTTGTKLCFPSGFEISDYILQTFHRSNQDTCLKQKPLIFEKEWIQQNEILADGAASFKGELALGKNILIGYMPWEGYNFEDAILISERLVYEDIYTSLHIERYEIEIRDTKFGVEQITNQIPELEFLEISHLDLNGIAKIGSWVKEGDILVGKVTPIKKKYLTPHEKLLYDIVGKEIPHTRDTSLRVPKGVQGRVINVQLLDTENIPPEIAFEGPGRVHIYLAEKRKIQVGDKMAGRHGNKGIVSKILSRQDMPFLPDGTILDMVLNPLGVPSRMNVGQVFECLLGLAGLYLGQQFKIIPFDEIYGLEASRSIVYSKLYEARLKTSQEWLFNYEFPGKTILFDGRTGDCFDQPVTVGQAYMLKLVHLVDEKIHARSTGPYSLVTQQPLRGRSKHGGQRLGEMEVWALEGFGAAYILQELLTVKSDDMKGRHQVMDALLNNEPISLGTPESFKVLIRELQSLCLDVGVYSIDSLGRRKQIDVMKLP